MSTFKKHHVAAFAFPFGSHPAALLDLVRRLATTVPDAQFSFFNTKISNQKLFSNVYLPGFDNIKHYDVHDGAPENHVFSGNPLEAIELFIKATPGNFKRRLKEVVGEIDLKVSCLLTDAFLWFSAEMAEELGIPWVAFWTAGPTSICLHMYTEVIHSRLGQKDQSKDQNQALDFIPGMSALHASDLPIEFKNLGMPFSRLLHSMSLAVPRATAVVLNSFDSLDPVVENDLKSKLQRLLNIGPFPLPPPMSPSEDQSSCLSWLDNQGPASVAYISFGTMLTPPPPELVALSEALEEKKVPYLWSFRDRTKLHLLQGFFERTSSVGKVVQWAPQLQVLRNSSVGVFVTHCGWNSVMESVTGGVPMIGRPFFGDQMINSRLVEDAWRIGVGVEGGVLEKSGLMNALDLVLVKEDGRKMRDNIGRLKECASIAVAESGSSSENFKSLVGIVKSPQQH